MAEFKHNYFQKRTKPKGPRANNRINSPEVQVIASNGENLGVLNTNKAILIAQEEDVPTHTIGKVTDDAKLSINELYKNINVADTIYNKKNKFTRTFTYCFAYPRVALAYPLQKYLLIYLVTICHTKLGRL